MQATNELQQLVQQLEDIVVSAADDTKLSRSDLRHMLAFIAKVAHVLDQAFQDVFATLIEIKFLENRDYQRRRAVVQKSLEMILARSKYRDAEEICSRLHHLRAQFESEIAPLLGQVGDRPKWQQLFWLIDDRERCIINIVQHTVYELSTMLQRGKPADLPQIRLKAGDIAESIRTSLSELRGLANQILGLSGEAGFLELTGNTQANTRHLRVLINKGSISMSRDSYSAGQSGAMGPGARAENMTFQQVWNRQCKNIDLLALAEELVTLRKAMRDQSSAPERDIAIGHVAAAENAARKQDGPTVMRCLKEAGKWSFEVATNIGAGLATAALKTALGV